MSVLLRSKNLLPATFPLYLGGKALTTGHVLRVVDKYTQEEFATVSAGDAVVANKAFELAQVTGVRTLTCVCVARVSRSS